MEVQHRRRGVCRPIYICSERRRVRHGGVGRRGSWPARRRPDSEPRCQQWRAWPSLAVAAGLVWAAQAQTRTVVYEGARLITGDGGAPLENSVFVVVNDRFAAVGRKGSVNVPARAVHVDLTGKTVMPGKVDTHGHFGFQHVADGTMAKEYFTRENLTAHLEILAYYGFSAAIGVGDLIDRSDLHGRRTGWGRVPLVVRDRSRRRPRCSRLLAPESRIPAPDRRATGHEPDAVQVSSPRRLAPPSATTRGSSRSSSRSGSTIETAGCRR